MIKQKLYSITFLLALTCTASLSYTDASLEASDSDLPNYTLPNFTVEGQKVANIRPSSTYQTVVSNLDFDPRIDFQSRNIAEAQGDINIRGGTFEGTGIQIGAATLIDPQTGHYYTELPIAPEMLSNPKVHTGTSNALHGFSSTSGTISYQWSTMLSGSSISVGSGDNGLYFHRLHTATSNKFNKSDKWSYGTEFEYSSSESDGTILNSDHEFSRINGRFQIIGPDSQLDFFAGSQDKYFGWPGMYTSNKHINPVEYEDIKTQLFLVNYSKKYSEESFLKISAVRRLNSDIYKLDAIRRNTELGDSNHVVDYMGKQDTRVSSLGFHVFNAYNSNFGVNYTGQIMKDYWRSSSTTESRYQSKLSFAPEYKLHTSNNDNLKIIYGVSFDNTSDDLPSESSYFGSIQWENNLKNDNYKSAYFSYSETSLVPGYTAIGQHKSSEFKSDPNLGRELSKIFEIGGTINGKNLTIDGTIFYRIDEDLVDWIYSYYIYDRDEDSPTFEQWILSPDEYILESRAASSVDMKTFGIELIASKKLDKFETIASYNYLNKGDIVYKNTNPDIEGSYYALNYAKHRITLSTVWEPVKSIKVRVDNEWRNQLGNKLRKSDNKAFFTHLSLSVFPSKYKELEFFASVDNLWNDDYEEMPGTPGKGRQGSLGATFRW